MANTGNTQQQINYGAAANDGQGDPLRTAFIKTDDNFDAIWNAGPVGSNITIVNNTLQSNNTNGNIVLRPNGVGVIQANAAIVPNATDLRDLGSADQRFRAAYIGTGGLSATGNVTANFFIGDGSLLTGVTGAYGNAEVADFLVSGFGNFGSNAIVTNGTIVASELDVANISHQFPLNIQTNGGGTWQFAGNILRGPQGGSWTSDADTSYFNSPANGFLNLTSLLNGNVVSELFMEHSFIRFFIDNGIDATWEMKADGRTAFPDYVFPYLDGNAGEVLKTNGAGNLFWTVDSSDYGNANVAAYLEVYGGNISADNINAGNVFTARDVVAKTGSFSGDERGENAVYAGIPLFTVLGSDVIAQFSGNVDAYTQFNFQNGSNGAQASGDYVITADNGNDITHFLNIGLAGSGWDGTQNNSLGNLIDPNDGYLYVQDGNLAIGTRDGTDSYVWKWDTTGTVTASGNLIPAANGVYSLGNSTNYWSNLWVSNNTIFIGGVPLGITGNTLTVNGEALLSNDSNTSITTTGNITADNFIGNGSQLTDLSVAPGNLIENGSSNVAITAPNGNVTVSVNTETWTFDSTGNLTVPNSSVITATSGYITIGSGDGSGLLVGASGALFNADNSNFVIYGNLSDPGTSITIPSDLNAGNGQPLTIENQISNVAITAGGNTWTFDTAGTLTAPGNIAAVRFQNDANLVIRSNVAGTIKNWTFDVLGDLNLPFGGNIVGSGSISANTGTFTGNVTAANFEGNISITGNVTGTSANVDLVAGAYEWSFDNTGNLTLPGNTFAVNYANNTPVDVVTRFEGAWTVPTGNSTQSFAVDGNHTYQMWVEGNIPNGIIAWNALVTVTNTNVPVLGQQFAWNYEGGGNVLLLTSIPNQIVGTAGTISNAAPVVTNTNVFSFGINNASGSEQSIRYGWIQIS